jgi:hypothetical protein
LVREPQCLVDLLNSDLGAVGCYDPDFLGPDGAVYAQLSCNGYFLLLETLLSGSSKKQQAKNLLLKNYPEQVPDAWDLGSLDTLLASGARWGSSGFHSLLLNCERNGTRVAGVWLVEFPQGRCG